MFIIRVLMVSYRPRTSVLFSVSFKFCEHTQIFIYYIYIKLILDIVHSQSSNKIKNFIEKTKTEKKTLKTLDLTR